MFSTVTYLKITMEIHRTKKTDTLTYQSYATKWQGLKESNPHQRFWRPLFYH